MAVFVPFCFFFFFFFLFFFSIILVLFKLQTPHPASPLHTWRLESQHYVIITTFLFSTPSHELGLGGGFIPPLHSPPLKFIPLGLLHSG